MEILCELEPTADLQTLVDRDHALLAAVHDGQSPALIRLWTSPQGLVVTRRDSRLPGFADAAQIFADQGWPVAVRTSGGGAVCHGPGCLNVSLIQPEPRERTFCPDRHYAALADLVVPALDIAASLAPVSGAYCPGDHDLQAMGKKIAGLSQRVRTGKSADGERKRTTLSHLTLTVEGSAGALTDQINQFYKQMGDARRFDPGASASLAELTGVAVSPADLAHAIAGLSKARQSAG